MSVRELSEQVEGLLEHYMDTKQSQPFANFIVMQFLQKQSDLSNVNSQLCAIWGAVDHYRDIELLVTVYQNFLRDVYSTMEIYFFVQSSRIIYRVINGDSEVQTGFSSLAEEYIPVERIVDIVEEIFKTSSAV